MGTTAALDRPSIRESALLRSTSGLPVRTKPLCGGRYRVPKASDIGDSEIRSLEEWSVPRYDEAIVSLAFMVRIR